MAENITQPTPEEQELLDDIIEDKHTKVTINGTNKQYNIGWLKRGAIRKISNVVNKDGRDDQVSCKISAIIILNGYWKIKFIYWILWRWFYYVKQYGDEQLCPIIEEGKKKIPVESYYIATILSTGMKDTMMTMTRREVEHFLQERNTVQPML